MIVINISTPAICNTVDQFGHDLAMSIVLCVYYYYYYSRRVCLFVFVCVCVCVRV
jgi:hypothetical protein